MWFDINRFHLLVLLTWQFSIFFASQQIFPIFSNYVPQWKCGDSEPTSDCDVYQTCKANLTFVNVAFKSAAMEYDWICGKSAYLKSLFSQIQFAGVLCGTFSFGAVSDVVGRKPVAVFALSLGILMNFVTGLAPNYQLLLGIRFFLGLSVGGTLVVVCTFVMEMLLPKQRMALRAFFNWGVARLMMTLIAMALPEWRISSIACAIAALPALIIIIFVFPESPTWLHNKGRLDEMKKSEKQIAKMAGVPYVPIEHQKIEHSKTVMEMLQTKGLMRRLFVLWSMWFVASICGYATDLNSNTISGDLFVNQILFSILIAVSKMILVIFDTHVPSFRRRTLHQGAQLVVCICFLILTFMTFYGYTGLAFLIVNLIGTVFIEYTWDACYLCAVESMETACRASATGTCSLVARIGAILAPMLNYANLWWPPSVYLTVVLLGTINLIISYFFLVETKNVNLDNVHIDPSSEEGTPMIDEKPSQKSDQ
ncbi:hypothetical protein B9Z55_009658 [Caenorhabditis nigoni]|uniref:Major facilitator superfamily (MFS) profile domain-containing protein n=1 Tax=Caenorhabditis nigoni TaxID=1611254 RepID=A0A2G5USZ8_9PELO|nr:hypothetical protein B9Z55_009658 [Caenorhabditis nigoni]